MNGTPRHIFLPALLAATLAATAAAQQAKPIANWANLNHLVTGAEIRVTLANGKTLRGFMQRVTPESLAVNATTSQEMLSRQDIRSVALKRPGHRGRNTLIGLAVGTGVGLAAGAVADSRPKHTHRVGGGNGCRPGRGRCRGFQGGPRHLVAEPRQRGARAAGSTDRHSGRGGAAYRWMARGVSRSMRPAAG